MVGPGWFLHRNGTPDVVADLRIGKCSSRCLIGTKMRVIIRPDAYRGGTPRRASSRARACECVARVCPSTPMRFALRSTRCYTYTPRQPTTNNPAIPPARPRTPDTFSNILTTGLG